MANTNYATDGTLGVKLDRVTDDQEFALGTVVIGNGATDWIYCQANGAVATGTCTLDASFQLTDTAGNYTAVTAFADNQFGWVYKTATTF